MSKPRVSKRILVLVIGCGLIAFGLFWFTTGLQVFYYGADSQHIVGPLITIIGAVLITYVFYGNDKPSTKKVE